MAESDRSMLGAQLELTAEETDDRPSQFKIFKWCSDNCDRYVCTALSLLSLVAIVLIVGLSRSGTVGGEDGDADAQEGTWPFVVGCVQILPESLMIEPLKCGGSLINNEWVLTSAHCFTRPEDVRVVLGTETLSDPNGVSRAVAEVVPHPAYDSETSANDLALLRLAAPVPFTHSIRPVCLAATGSVFSNGTPSWAFGWGHIKGKGVLQTKGRVHGNLQQVQVPVLDNKACNRTLHPVYVTDNMICADFREVGRSCEFGSPMVSKYGSDWVQSGVAGFPAGRPYKCYLPLGPFARVDRYEAWIKSVVKTGLCFVSFEDSNSTRPGLPAAAVGSAPEDPADLDLEDTVEE